MSDGLSLKDERCRTNGRQQGDDQRILNLTFGLSDAVFVLLTGRLHATGISASYDRMKP